MKSSKSSIISTAHQSILDDRLAAYKKAPDAVLDWETVKKEIEQTFFNKKSLTQIG